MQFQVWLRLLLSDAVSKNMAYRVAELSPHALKALYEQGISPSVEAINHDHETDRRAA